MKFLTPEEIGAENVKKRAAGISEEQITDKQIGNVADAFINEFTIGTSNAQTCSVAPTDLKFRVFVNTVEGRDGSADIIHNKFIEIEKQDFTKDITGPMKISYIMEITSKLMAEGSEKYSNLVKNDITVCGNEKLKLTDDASYEQTFKNEDGDTITAEIAGDLI